MAAAVRLRWRTDTELSAAHATCVVASGAPCTDKKTEQALLSPVSDINNRLLSASLDVSKFWNRYLLGTLVEASLDDVCYQALLASGCSELQVEQTSKAVRGKLSDARVAFLNRYPKLAEQLELRARPLRDKWETYGPGLLRAIANRVWQKNPPDNWWPSRLDIHLVQPLRGGAGGVDVPHRRVWIEAMLTDVDPSVPEILRIAWLLTRIATESHRRPAGGDVDHADGGLTEPWSLAAIPLVLSAASELDLVHEEPLPIERAMELWQFGSPAAAEQVQQWWREQQRHPQPLPVALKSLQRRR